MLLKCPEYLGDQGLGLLGWLDDGAAAYSV